MKTLIAYLIALLMSVSGPALAAGGDDLRSSDTYFGKYSQKHRMEGQASDSNAFAVVKSGKAKLTNFERMNMLEGEGRGGGARASSAALEN
jgi:hypothetical protein